MDIAQQPTASELEVLKLFWREGDMSAREVQDALPQGVSWAISTTRTVLERMREKGLLAKRSVHGLAVYSAAQAKVAIVATVVSGLRSLLDIDGALPASAFAGSQLLSADELDELQRLLDADGGSHS